MASTGIRRALISVYDKTGVVDFARALSDEFEVEILSTGGTAALLKENKIPVTLVEEVTGFPEMMDGRVKTLHPRIHAGILADRTNPDHLRQLQEQGIKPIDMVVVNLYPFEKTVADAACTLAQAIEMIDIGGPCLLRAAAKNNRCVLPVAHQDCYEDCLAFLRGELDDDEANFRSHLACFTFGLTAAYDMDVHRYFAENGEWACEDDGESAGAEGTLPEDGEGLFLSWPQSARLRYGENPHQDACFLIQDRIEDGCLAPEKVLSGAEVSFNNYADAGAALDLCKELTRELAGGSPGRAVCVFAKHTNPCGVGIAEDSIEACRRAYLGDPNAAMGGILACNTPVSEDFATAVMETYDRWGKAAGAGGFFVEVWLAPSFSEEAFAVINTRKKWGERVRLFGVGDMTATPAAEGHTAKTVVGGMLIQTPDLLGLNEDQWNVVTKRTPTDAEMADLRLAWLACKHTKSNAITVCKDDMLLGNGAGQMSRVMSCRIATWMAKENGHADRLMGASAASDAFFPFRDGPDILADAGVTALIQPGGSKRDEDTIKACDERGLAMIFTGTRHFRH